MNKDLLVELLKYEFKLRFGSLKNAFWWIIFWPAVIISLYIIIFSKLFGRYIGNLESPFAYGAYVAVGIVTWNFFASIVQRMASVFHEKRHILSKIPVSLLLFPQVILLFELINFITAFIVLVIIFYILGVPILNKNIPFLLLSSLILVTYTFSLGILFFIFGAFLKIFKELSNLFLQLYFWLTPVVYPLEILPDFLQGIIVYNPMNTVLALYREVFIHVNSLPETFITIHSLISIFMFIISFYILKISEKSIRDLL